jgi:hypothetical protein
MCTFQELVIIFQDIHMYTLYELFENLVRWENIFAHCILKYKRREQIICTKFVADSTYKAFFILACSNNDSPSQRILEGKFTVSSVMSYAEEPFYLI